MKTRTFFFTDIEGSTPLRERAAVAYKAALARHFEILRGTIAAHDGELFRNSGDGVLAVFESSSRAVACAAECQRLLRGEPWPEPLGEMRVRIGLHRGEAEAVPGDFDGIVMHHATRVLDAAHGAQILCSETVRGDVPEAERHRMTDLGLYRLRGVAAPMRLFQLAYAETPEGGFPPLRVPAAFTQKLPAPPTRFFGRDREIAELVEMLRPGRPERLVTLLGPGGTGKTRLSIEVATRLLAEYSGAVWFVALAELREPSLIFEKVREALGLGVEAGSGALDQSARFLAGQPSLLVLDNLEQLLPGAAVFVEALLGAAPSLACIVSSRVRLGLAREREFSLHPLPTPGSAAAADELPHFESVRLFVDRVRSVRREFALSPENARDVANLCHALEGIPLALELAAARGAVLTPRQMHTRLSGRLEFLTGGKRDFPERHRALRAAIAWSFHLLSSPLQILFSRCSIFRGGCSIEAAEAILAEENGGTCLDGLAELQGASLLIAEEHDGAMRYRMLEMIREFAEEQLTPAERALMAARHHRFFADIACRPWDADEARRLRELEADHDNLRAMLGGDGPPEERLQAVVGLFHFWYIRGHLREAREWFRRFAEFSVETRTRVRASHAEGILACHGGDTAEGKVLLLEALALYGELGDEGKVAAILNSLGVVAGNEMDFAAASDFLARSLAIFRRLEMPSEIGRLLNNIGQNFVRLNDLASAEIALAESLAILRSCGEQFHIAHALESSAELHCAARDFPMSRRALAESISLRENLRSRDNLETTLATLSRIALGEGEAVAAARLHGAARATILEGRTVATPQLNAQLAADRERIAQVLGPAAFARCCHEGRDLAIADILHCDGTWKMGLTGSPAVEFTSPP